MQDISVGATSTTYKKLRLSGRTKTFVVCSKLQILLNYLDMFLCIDFWDFFVYQRRRIFMRNFTYLSYTAICICTKSRYITIWLIIYALYCLIVHFSSNAIYSKLYNSLYGNSRRSYQSIQLDWSDFCRYVEIQFYVLFKMPKTKFRYRIYFRHNAGSFYLYR